MTANLLIIEDDQAVNQLISQNLKADGYDVTSIFDGAKGIELALAQPFDLILLDLMIPSVDGLAVLSKIREYKQTPVLILSARGGEQDRIVGFRSGADDYLVKPFSIPELSLRIEAILRRTQQPRAEVPASNPHIRLNHSNGNVSIKGHKIPFTPLEFNLLDVLMQGAGSVLTKAYLYQAVLCREYSRYDRTLDMHISKIRKKLSAAGLAINTIKTVRGQGYMLEPQTHNARYS